MIEEIKKKRSLNSKTYKYGKTRRQTKISSGIIHYENSERLVGDGVGGLRDINKSWIKGIVEETPEKVWNEETQDFDEIQTIPNLNKECYYYDFADDPVRAGLKANELIRYIDYFNNRAYSTAFIPQCNSVDGQIVDNDIVYNNAFSTGQDLVLRPTKSSLQKLVRLRDYSIQDYTFDFEIIIENFTAKGLSIFRVDQTGQNETYSIDLMSLFTTPKVFDNPNRITVIGQTENDGTIIKPPKAWFFKDGERIEIDIQTELFGDAQTGKFYLRKYIPSAFLQDANGEVVYTDTETTIGTTSNIELLKYSDTISYESVLSATTANSVENSSYSPAPYMTDIGKNNSNGGTYFNWKGVCYFPISSLSGVTVTGFEVNFKESSTRVVSDDFAGDTNGNDYYALVESSISDYTSIGTGDFDLHNTNKLTDDVDSTISAGATITFSSNASGVSNLQTAITNGDTNWGFFFLGGHQINQQAPSNLASNRFQAVAIENNGTTNEPELIVTYDVGTVASVDVDSTLSTLLYYDTNVSWADVRGSATADGYLVGGGQRDFYLQSKNASGAGNQYAIGRFKHIIDISSFATTDIVNNGILYVKKDNDINNFTDSTKQTEHEYQYHQLINFNGDASASKALTDYNDTDFTVFSGKSNQIINANEWIALQLNSAGILALQTAISNGDNYFGIFQAIGYDIENVEPNDIVSGAGYSGTFYNPIDAGNEPYIEIDYSSGGGGGGESNPNYFIIME